jgi:hypothetical protein
LAAYYPTSSSPHWSTLPDSQAWSTLTAMWTA